MEGGTGTSAKDSAGSLMMGMIGAFILVLVAIIGFLPYFKVRLSGTVLIVTGILALAGYIGMGIGLLGISKVKDNGMAKGAAFSFFIAALVALVAALGPLFGSLAIVVYGAVAHMALAAISFLLAGLAVNGTKDLWGSFAMVVSSGFFAIAAFYAFKMVTALVNVKMPGTVVHVISIAFIIAQLAGLGAAGLSFNKMRSA